jgi:hypothetical protein
MKKLSMLLLVLIATTVGCDFFDNKKKQADNGLPADIVTVNTDYTTGSFSKITLSDFTVNNLHKGTILTDPAVRSYNGLIYVINRYDGSNIQVIDPSKGNVITTEMSMGTSVNPQDICVVSPTKAYVTRYDAKELWIINPLTLVKTGEIDLSSYTADSSGIPCMHKIYFDSARSQVFVSLQRLQRSSGYKPPVDYSSVLVLDTNTDSIKANIHLIATNPYSDFVAVPHSLWAPAIDDNNDHLFISCGGYSGFYYQEDAGVVAIDPVDLHCESGYIVDESVIHAEVTVISLTGDNLYMVYSDSSNNNTVMKKSLSTKTTSNVYTTAGYYPSMVINSSGLLFLCDRSITNPGIRVFDTTNNDVQKFANPLNTDLPPFDITVVK